MTEKIRHVVTHTRCTKPDANRERHRHTRISGKILAWKPFPKTRFSRLLKAVREQTNSTDPRKPPRMVSHSEEPSCRLNICIPANTSTDSRLDNTRDVLVFTAVSRNRVYFSSSFAKARVGHGCFSSVMNDLFALKRIGLISEYLCSQSRQYTIEQTDAFSLP